MTGDALFVEASEFTVLPLAHLVGGVVGAAFAVSSRRDPQGGLEARR